MATAESATFEDSFRKESAADVHDRDKTFALDTTHFGALVLRSISEGHEPGFQERSWYDQLFLEAIATYDLANPRLGDAALASLLLSEKLIVPNIDVFWTKRFGIGDAAIIEWASTGTYYERKSRECRKFLSSLAPQVLRHPLSQHHQLTQDQYESAIDEILGFKEGPNPRRPKAENRRYVLVQALIQEARTVMAFARENGIPAVSELLSRWPTVQRIPKKHPNRSW